MRTFLRLLVLSAVQRRWRLRTEIPGYLLLVVVISDLHRDAIRTRTSVLLIANPLTIAIVNIMITGTVANSVPAMRIAA
jgi:hypothetical protein